MPEVCALVKPLTADGSLENETDNVNCAPL
jgi:hypothetical protein